MTLGEYIDYLTQVATRDGLTDRTIENPYYVTRPETSEGPADTVRLSSEVLPTTFRHTPKEAPK